MAATAQTLGPWQFANPAPQGNGLYGVTAGAGRVVAVGTSGAIVTSTDGTTWTMPAYGSADWLYDVCWGNGRFVAVGWAGTVVTSTDGTTWSPATSPTGPSPDEVAFGGGTFLAGSGSGQIYISGNGTSWSQVGDFNTYGIDGFAWNGHVWVAVGGDPAIQVSASGYGWSPVATEVKNLSDVVWTGSQFVAVGTNKALTSPDGYNWTQHDPGMSGLGQLAWNGSTLVAVGSRAYSAAGQIATSPDGVTWTLQNSGVSHKLYAVAWSGSLFVAVGQAGVILTSPDGVTWTRRDSSSVTGWPLLREVTWTGSGFVAVGSDGAILTSDSTGTTWSERSSGVTASIGGVARTATGLVAVGAGGTILSSPDGMVWTPVTSPTSENLNNLYSGGPLVVAVGSNGTLLTSPNGVDWTQRTSGTTKHLQDVVWNGSKFVLVGSDGTVLASTDGDTWTPQPFQYNANDLSGVAWNGSLFVAVGSGGMLWSSSDGSSWSYHDAGLTGTYTDVTWIGGEFVAVGQSGNTAVSPDGVSWSARPAATMNRLYGVAWSGQRCVAVGEAAMILTAPCGHADLAIDSVTPAVGPTSGGTQVTLRGRGFAAGAQVRFDGIPGANLSVVDATTITVTTPPHVNGVVDVTVSGSANKTGTLVAAFSYVDMVPLTISASPSSLTAYPGESAQITVSVTPTPSVDVAIALSSEKPAAVAVPASVTVPAGQSSASFNVTVVGSGSTIRVTATLPSSAGGGSAFVDVLVRTRALVAAAAHAPGLNQSQWRTDLVAVNDTATSQQLDVVLVGAGAPTSRTVTLPSGATVAWSDVLVSLFGYDVGASVKGTLQLNSDVPLRFAVRTYNQQADGGTFGQYMPAVPATQGVASGELGWLPQLKRNDGFRTNIGLLNLSPSSVAVRIRLFDATGTQLAERSITVGGYLTTQETDIFQSTGAGDQDVAFATIEVLGIPGRVWAWASVVDNATNDPTTVPLMRAGDGGPYFIAAAAHAPGLVGSQWRTDVSGVNPSASDLTLNVAWQPPSGSPSWQNWTLPAGQTAEWQDILVSLFGVDPGASSKGTLIASTPVGVLLSARTYNQKSATETFGQFIPAITEAEALAAGDVGIIAGLKKTESFRTNIGLVNLGNTSCSVRISLFGADGGQLAEKTVSVGGWQTYQETDIFATTGAGNRDIAYATIEPLTSGGVVWSWASVVDMGTNDPTTLPVLLPGPA